MLKKIFTLFICITISVCAFAWYDTARWMNELPDSTYICSMTLPGTHDTFTYNLGITASWGQTQTLDVCEQFESGVRVFDLRPVYTKWTDYDEEGNVYNHEINEIYHGKFSTDINTDEAFKSLENLVSTYSSEFIIAIISIECDSDSNTYPSTQAFLKEKEEGMKGNDLYVQEYRADLTLGEVRGKILIINRDDLPHSEGEELYGFFTNGFTGAYTESYLTLNGRASSGGTPVMKYYVQDKDHYVRDYDFLTEKFAYFEKVADNYYADPDYYCLCINNTSGWCGESVVTMDYNENADVMNYYVSHTYIPNTPRYHVPGKWRGLGIVLMDFAGEKSYGSHFVYGYDLVCTLINLNF